MPFTVHTSGDPHYRTRDQNFAMVTIWFNLDMLHLSRVMHYMYVSNANDL